MKMNTIFSAPNIAINIMKLSSRVVDLTAGVFQYLMKIRNVAAIAIPMHVEYVTDITVSGSSYR